jgi:hypothetical protein
MRSGEATNTNFIVISLTRSALESTIYRTRGEHANHYTTSVAHFSVVDVKRWFSIRYWLLQSVRSRWRGHYFDGDVCIQFEMKTYKRNNIHFVLSSTDCYHILFKYPHMLSTKGNTEHQSHKRFSSKRYIQITK